MENQSRASIIGYITCGDDVYVGKLFFNDDDRVEIFDEKQRSIGLVFTASSEIKFKDKLIGRHRFPYTDETTKTIKLELYRENEDTYTISTDVTNTHVECFVQADLFTARYLLENKLITLD